MLSPKKVKHRKQQKGRMKGTPLRGTTLQFGDYGLQALGCGFMTAQQIEAARIAITRHVKRGGSESVHVLSGAVHVLVLDRTARGRQPGGKRTVYVYEYVYEYGAEPRRDGVSPAYS